MTESENQPFDWFNTSNIEKEHDRLAGEASELIDHLTVIHSSLRALHSMTRFQPYEGNVRTLVVLRLASRMINSAGASLKCSRAGFFQPALSLVRDILEVEFLTDLFVRDSNQLDRWIELDPEKRKREFRQVCIRKTLDDLDGFKERKREAAYKLLSSYAVHATPEGSAIISPNGMTQIGPFSSDDRLTAFFQELAKHLPMVCIHIYKLLSPLVDEVEVERRSFYKCLVEWRDTDMPNH